MCIRRDLVWLVVFNATFNNISVISSVFLVEEYLYKPHVIKKFLGFSSDTIDSKSCVMYYRCIDINITIYNYLRLLWYNEAIGVLILYIYYIYCNIKYICNIYTRLYTCLTSILRFALREKVTLRLLKLLF